VFELVREPVNAKQSHTSFTCMNNPYWNKYWYVYQCERVEDHLTDNFIMSV